MDELLAEIETAPVYGFDTEFHRERTYWPHLALVQLAWADQVAKQLAASGIPPDGRVRSLAPDVVLSPALGGIVIGQEVGRALGVRAIFAERQDGKLTLRRGFALEPGEKVLVVEDVVTTGGSTQETIDVARAAGARVVGAAAIIDRSGGTAAFDVKRASLATVSASTWPPEACPLCKSGGHAIKPGSRV